MKEKESLRDPLDPIIFFTLRYLKEVLTPCLGMQLSANVLYTRYRKHFCVYATLRGLPTGAYQKRPTFYKNLEKFLNEHFGSEIELIRTSQGVFLTNVTFNPSSLAAVDFRITSGSDSFPLKMEVSANNADYVPLWFYAHSFEFVHSYNNSHSK
jgi:hypothetical protein